jgi:cytochrome c556
MPRSNRLGDGHASEGELMKSAAIAFWTLLVMGSGPSWAAPENATGPIKERIETMEDMGKRMKAIRERIDGKRDLPGIEFDAEIVASHAPHLLHLFPRGSAQRPSDAKETIWRNWTDFEHKAQALEAETEKLAKMKSADFASLNTQVRAVTAACGSCHESYRTKRRKGDM